MPIPKDPRGACADIFFKLKNKCNDMRQEVSDADIATDMVIILFDFIWYLGIEAATADATENITDPIDGQHIEGYVERLDLILNLKPGHHVSRFR